MQDWISRYGSEIKGVIAENDDMGIGAIRALEEKGLAGKIPVGGVDAIKGGLREVKSGNQPAKCGYRIRDGTPSDRRFVGQQADSSDRTVKYAGHQEGQSRLLLFATLR